MEFSDIALAKLLQTVPELGALIVTFQDVTEELPDESDTKVGVFVLRSGSDIFYVPVVSKNDNVYPIDSIFFESKKKFFPLTKKTVALITSSSQLEQGKPARIPTTVVGNPSVYELINPPRTGKYVYASSSRLVDFMSSLPDQVKANVFEKIAAEKSVYDDLDKLFGLKAIFDVLKPQPQSLAAKTSATPLSVVTAANPSLTPEGINNILKDGYHIVGDLGPRRVAISTQSFNLGGTFRQITEVDGDNDYNIVFENGTTREAFIPKMQRKGGRALALFTNSDYAIGDSFIAVGDDLNRKDVMDRLFEYNPPVLLRECSSGDTVLISLPDGTFAGPFNIDRIALTAYGVDTRVTALYNGDYRTTYIKGYRTFRGSYDYVGDTLYVQSNVVVIRLAKNISSEVETHMNGAQQKRELAAIQYLGSEMNLGFDGVEFLIDGRAVGGEPKVMERLVVTEGIDPEVARSFVKEARLTKRTRIYMTKAAESTDYSPAAVPQYGLTAANPDLNIAPNGAVINNGTSFMPNVSQSVKLGDAQVTEATIISELLQVPDMFEVIREYLPQIEEAIDKLGRILFVSRVHIDKLSQNGDADNIFAFLAGLKSVYRLLGDNYLKLQEMSSAIAEVDPDQSDK